MQKYFWKFLEKAPEKYSFQIFLLVKLQVLFQQCPVLIITDLFLKTLQKFSKRLLSGTTFSDTSYCSNSEHYVQRTLRKEI